MTGAHDPSATVGRREVAAVAGHEVRSECSLRAFEKSVVRLMRGDGESLGSAVPDRDQPYPIGVYRVGEWHAMAQRRYNGKGE